MQVSKDQGEAKLPAPGKEWYVAYQFEHDPKVFRVTDLDVSNYAKTQSLFLAVEGKATKPFIFSSKEKATRFMDVVMMMSRKLKMWTVHFQVRVLGPESLRQWEVETEMKRASAQASKPVTP